MMMKSLGSFVRNPPVLVQSKSKNTNATFALPVYYTPLGLKDKASQYGAIRITQSPDLHFDDESSTEVQLTHPGDYLAQPALSTIASQGKSGALLLAAFRDRRGESLYMSSFTASLSGTDSNYSAAIA